MSTNRPFIRIAATYPTTDDGRLPNSVEIELDVDDVAPEEDPAPLDGDEFPSAGFTRFVCEVVQTLGGIGAKQPTSVHVFSMKAPPGLAESLGDLFGHAPDCDGTCDQPAADQPTDPAAGEPLPEAAPVLAAAGERGGA